MPQPPGAEHILQKVKPLPFALSALSILAFSCYTAIDAGNMAKPRCTCNGPLMISRRFERDCEPPFLPERLFNDEVLMLCPSRFPQTVKEIEQKQQASAERDFRHPMLVARYFRL